MPSVASGPTAPGAACTGLGKLCARDLHSAQQGMRAGPARCAQVGKIAKATGYMQYDANDSSGGGSLAICQPRSLIQAAALDTNGLRCTLKPAAQSPSAGHGHLTQGWVSEADELCRTAWPHQQVLGMGQHQLSAFRKRICQLNQGLCRPPT